MHYAKSSQIEWNDMAFRLAFHFPWLASMHCLRLPEGTKTKIYHHAGKSDSYRTQFGRIVWIEGNSSKVLPFFFKGAVWGVHFSGVKKKKNPKKVLLRIWAGMCTHTHTHSVWPFQTHIPEMCLSLVISILKIWVAAWRYLWMFYHIKGIKLSWWR